MYDGLSSRAELKYADMLVITYNALMSEVLEFSKTDGDLVIREGSGETALSKDFDIYVGEDVISGYDEISVFGDSVGANMVMIGDMVLSAENMDVTEYLGMKVKYLYKYTDDEASLVWVKPTDKNEVVKLNKFENSPVFDEASFSVKYYTSSGKRKSLSLADNVSVVYNGAYVGKGIREVLNKDSYEMKFISAEGDNVYDVVIIEDYKNYIFRGISEEILYLEPCDGTDELQNINTEDFERIEISTTDGKIVELDSLSNGMLLSIKQTTDCSCLTINVSTSIVKGQLTKIEDNGDGYTVFVIDDNEYISFNKRNFDAVLGSSVNLYLDGNNYVAFVELTTGTTQYGYLIRTLYDELEEVSRIKIYNQEKKIDIYNVADTIYVDGKKLKNDPKRLEELLNGVPYPQVIVFKTNARGEITLIDTPEEASTAEKTDKNMFTLEEKISNCVFENRTSKLGPKTILNSSTVVLGIPNNPSDSLAERFTLGTKSLFRHGFGYNGYSYNYGMENDIYTDILVTATDFQLQGLGTEIRVLVDKIYKAVNDDGEIVSMVKGYRGDSSAEFKFTADISQKAEALKRGDIIHITASIDGAISNFTLEYSPHTGQVPSSYYQQYNIYNARALMLYINDIKGSTIKAGYKSGADFDEIVTLQSRKIRIYDSKNNRIEDGSPADLISYKVAGDNCSLIYYLINDSYASMIVIYK